MVTKLAQLGNPYPSIGLHTRESVERNQSISQSS